MAKHGGYAAIALAAATALVVPSHAAPSAVLSSNQGDVDRLRLMTPSAFQARTTLSDDALDRVATLTSTNGFVEHRSFGGHAPDDVFLRAFIDKTTGQVSYQVYASIRYRAYSWVRWDSATYEAPGGPLSARVDRIARLRTVCQRGWICPRSETIGLRIAGSVLRQQAELYIPGVMTPWQFKVTARAGGERILMLSTAEIAGMLMAVDAYRVGHHLPQP
jgi:hypothetical protein